MRLFYVPPQELAPLRRIITAGLAMALLLGGFVSCRKNRAPETVQSAASPTPVVTIKSELLAPFEKVLDPALAAYNSGDVVSFDAFFARDAHPPADEHTFQALFEGIYQPEFGNYLAKRVMPAETVPDPDYGQVVYNATFEKRPRVKVSANFVRQDGALKIKQLRFEKM
jgi:hypothetical protein